MHPAGRGVTIGFPLAKSVHPGIVSSVANVNIRTFRIEYLPFIFPRHGFGMCLVFHYVSYRVHGVGGAVAQGVVLARVKLVLRALAAYLLAGGRAEKQNDQRERYGDNYRLDG